MIISRAEIQSAISAYKTVKRKPTVATVAHDTDRFVGSDAASSLAALSQALSADPYYRSDLVEGLQRQIARGQYFVPSEDIVDKLLGRLLVEAAV
jgi:anti-sigma28 factor (negative regulator of flagellin synthesis)